MSEINSNTKYRIVPWYNDGQQTYAVEISEPFLLFWTKWKPINSGPLDHCVTVIEYQHK